MEKAAINSQLKKVISAVSLDKNLDRSIIVEALEQAILHAAKRTYGIGADLEAHYNEETDEIDLFQFRTVVENLEDKDTEITMPEAHKLDPAAEIGDALGIKLDTQGFGRIAAQSAKQIIVQKVRDAERTQIYDEFKDRVGEILSGHIRRFERGNIIIDLGRTEAIIPYKEQIPTEKFRVKDRVQGYVIEVKRASRGPQVIMSRAHTGFLIKLFEQAVTEIYDGIVTIESAARDAGLRSKVAVYSKDSSIDPVGACVGMKGSRVQSVVNELNGEKIDIIPYDQDPAKLVCNALAPAVVSKVIVDDENHSMEVVVPNDQLSLAIGKRGQNVKLAAQLTGWRLDIKSEAKLEEQLSISKQALADIAGLGPMHAEILANEGVKSIAEVAELTPRTLCRFLNLDEDVAIRVIEEAKKLVASGQHLVRKGHTELHDDETRELLANSSAAPSKEKIEETNTNDEERERRIKMFTQFSGVGEAAAHALADAGYATVGDVIADSAEEVSMKTGLSLGVAKTVQIAVDRHIQRQLMEDKR